jgi:hypothetical protein
MDEAKTLRLASEKDVGCDIEVVREIELLMNQGNAEMFRRPHTVDTHRPVFEQNLAAVGFLHTGENLHQRALARAVLANDRQNFTLVQRERNVVQRPHAGELFGEGACFQQSRGSRREEAH